MKSRFAKLVSSIQTFSKRQQMAIIAATVLAIALPTTVFALRPAASQPTAAQPTEPKTQEVAAATTEATPAPEPQPEAVTPQTNTQTKKTSLAPAPQPAPKSSPKPAYNNSTALPQAQVMPPAFNIIISPWAIRWDSPKLFYIAFSVKHDPGHSTKVVSASASVQPASAGIVCTPMFRDNRDHGELVVYVPDSAPNGQYKCVTLMSDGTTTRQAQFTFTVTDTSAGTQ